MKVKRRTICQTCRKRKISCDGKLPACTQCSFRGLTCPGYTPEWTFVAHNVAPHTDPPQPKNPAAEHQTEHQLTRFERRAEPHQRTAGVAPTDVPRPLETPLEHLITFIVRRYVPEPDSHRPLAITAAETEVAHPRVCGAWVEVLPELAGGRNEALSSAIHAFAVTLLGVGEGKAKSERASLSSARESYSMALGALRRELQPGLRSPSPLLPSQIAAAIMCLLLAELFLPTTLSSWTTHLEGFAQSMRLAKPEFYASGMRHKLFVGARPILVVLGFIVRKRVFLAEEDWRRIPFSQVPASPLQELMGEAAGIPAVLESLDQAGTMPRASGISIAKSSLRQLVAVLENLESWKGGFHSRFFKTPMFGSTLVGSKSDSEWPNLYFQSITDANVATHFWAFRVICLATIEQVAAQYPEAEFDRQILAALMPGSNTVQEMIQLSTHICQSMAYLMQEEMKLFGPSSILLPLRVAYDTFLAGQAHTAKQLAWCRSFLTDTIESGYRFVPVFFDPF